MIYEKIKLNELYNVSGGELIAMCVQMPFDRENKHWKRPAIIVVPGGAYAFCSKREMELVALEFMSKGYNAFVLNYSCGDEVHYPEQLLELAVAVDYVKNNAKQYSVNPKEIFAVGFSAGGHLVGSLSTDYTVACDLYEGKIDPKLTAAGLIYPVISNKFGHTDSFDYLFRGTNVDFMSKHINNCYLDECVCKNTVPTFLFSTYMDKTVPSINAIKYAEALANSNIPYELHIYKNGGHGMSIANAEINENVDGISRNKAWTNDLAEFFRDYVKELY